ncbi:SCO4402 family protein [Streptomyces asoensis]|uniref:SCO4402 family protein n=1 Tax=Streptomyces asoensis TaxID=249586 RepID=UPI0033C074F3
MIDHGVALPYYRLHVAPAVVALASPTWQREVWLDPDQFEDLGYTVHMLFDDFCDASNPLPWLGQCLRSEEEVELMARLGAAYSAVQESVGAAASDEVYLDSPGWSAVVAAAARLAQVLVSSDHSALSKLHDAGYRWPLETEPVSSGTEDQNVDS